MRLIATILLLQIYLFGNAQSMPLNLNHCYGGSGNEDRCFGTIELQHGFLLTGKTNSSNFDVVDFKGYEDGLLVRIDTSGNIVWSHAYGNTNLEAFFTSIKTSDGNLLSVGYSSGIGGQVTSNAGGTDFWVLKTDTSGNIIWQKSYGGFNDDVAYDVVEMQDGTYLVAGLACSNTGLLTDHHGSSNGSDVWCIRLDPISGNLLWCKSYGGGQKEGNLAAIGYHKQLSLITTSDTSFAFTCGTISLNGDVHNNTSGNQLYWLAEVGESGTIIFENCYGAYNEESCDLVMAPDSGFVVVGTSNSNNTGQVTGHHSNGFADMWVVKTDRFGVLEWQKSIGGTSTDNAKSIFAVHGGYYVFGSSDSNDGDCFQAGAHGNFDYMVAAIDTIGNVKAVRLFGGSLNEEGHTVLIDSIGDVICTGHSSSIDFDVPLQHPGHDYWIVGYTDTLFIDTASQDSTIIPPPEPIDSVIYGVWPNPGNETVFVNPGPDFHSGEYIIYDMRGRLVMKDVIYSTPALIDVEKLLAAVYELVLTDQNGKRYYYSWVKY